MRAQPPRRIDTRRAPQLGYSLLELMIVVMIVGILAAIALPTFNGYILRSRTTEATQFLGVIKLRQESYRAEFGQYAKYNGSVTSPTSIVWVPALSARHHPSDQAQFPDDDQYFNLIGAKPDGWVRFSYGWAAGLPTEAGTAVGGDPYDGPADHYFVAQAIADLNDDETYCTFEVTSFTPGVWFKPARGWD
jgi:prepilin-type N-terminal cleavage/methylation domain-containing protein